MKVYTSAGHPSVVVVVRCSHCARRGGFSPLVSNCTTCSIITLWINTGTKPFIYTTRQQMDIRSQILHEADWYSMTGTSCRPFQKNTEKKKKDEIRKTKWLICWCSTPLCLRWSSQSNFRLFLAPFSWCMLSFARCDLWICVLRASALGHSGFTELQSGEHKGLQAPNVINK